MNARSARAYAGLAGRILAARLGSPWPFKITLALTDRCDCRCVGCRIWEKPKGREMTPDEVEGMLGRVPSLRWVNLTGGELFLRDDVPEIAEAATRALPRLAVLDFPTTGQRTDRIVEDVRRVARLGIPRVLVTVSVEGPPDHHDRVRGRAGAFDRAVRTFAAVREVPGVEAYLGMTLTEENEDLAETTLRAVGERLPAGARALGWKDLHLNVWVRSPHYYANLDSDARPPRRASRALARALRARASGASPEDRIEATYLRLVPAYLASGRSPIPCRSLSASVFVAAGGDVYPCTVWGRRLGNALERPLDEILQSAEAAATRADVARDRCPGCWSPCEAYPTIVASAPGSLVRGRGDVRRRRQGSETR